MDGLDASRVINGSFGKVFIDGVWNTEFNGLEATLEADKRAIKTAGTLYEKQKIVGLRGTGTISGLKVTSAMLQRGFAKFEIISKLEDPEAYGFERIRLKGCMVDRLQLANWKAGEEVTEEIPFTFEAYEMLDPIVGP